MSLTLPEGIELPQEHPLASLLGGLGTGIQTGAAETLKNMLMMQKQRAKEEMNQKDIQKIFGDSDKQDASGDGTTQLEKIATNAPLMAQLSSKQPQVAKQIQDMYGNLLKKRKLELEEKKIVTGQELKRELSTEDKLDKMSEHLENLEMEDMRFARMGEIISPENKDKFPSSLTVALFSKNGELRPAAMSQLSPEAQEFTKLVVDQLSGAKDTFGARVTNFDVQTFMKRLPSLLNTADGRQRILRDLRLINKINTLHDREVLNIVDKAGGSGKISLSKAKAIFRNKFKDEIKSLRKEFINPSKSAFSSMENADPSIYRGRRGVDEETGQVFISDGKNWVPEK